MSAGNGDSCDLAAPACGSGLTCVPQAPRYDQGEYRPTLGKCRRACDPCDADPCAAGEQCVKLEDSGGFCSSGLLAPGESCDDTELCGGRLTCSSWSGCVPYCIPEVEGVGTAAFGKAASPSDDCSIGSVCVPLSLSSRGDLYSCKVGEVVGVGMPCAGEGVYCAMPSYCRPIDLGGGRNVLYTCNSSSGSCSATQPCDNDAQCWEGHCIKPGQLPLGSRCFDDSNCENWLECHNDYCRPAD